MASTTSVISLVVLLLATYCYSIPIGQGYDMSTANYDFSTSRTMAQRGVMSMQMDQQGTPNQEDTNEGDTQQKPRYPERSADEDYSVTTERFMEAKPKRGTDESDEVTTERFMQEKPKRGTDEDYSVTTERFMESKPKRGTGESDEVTTERFMQEKPKRGTVENDDQSDEATTELSMDEKPKRGTDESDEVTTERFMQEKPKRGTNEDYSVTTERFMESKPKRGTGESDEVTTEGFMQEKPKRGTDEDYSVTTERFMESKPKRGTGESDETTAEGHFEKDDETVNSVAATSERQYDVRAFEDDFLSTMESSTEFNNRATRFEKVASEDKKTSDAHFTGMEKTSTFEPTSSGESFGKSTGLLQQDQMEEKFTTSRYDNEHVPLTEQHLTKTETIIPGRIFETKIYSGGMPGRTYVVDEPMTIRPSQLSQGETYEHNSKSMSNN